MPIAAVDISADRVRKRRSRSRHRVRLFGPESAALFVIGLPLAWLTWRSAGVDAEDQAIVFGWVLGCVAVASVALKGEARIALGWPAVLIALMPLVQLFPLGNGAAMDEFYALFAANGVAPPEQISVYPYATIRMWLVVAGCCALFAMARTLASRSVQVFLVVALSLLAIGLVQAVLGLEQHLASQTMEGPVSQFGRGTFVNRDHYAALMEGCFGLAVGLALAMIAGRNWRHWLVGRESTVAIGALLVAGACGMAVVISYSRMGILVLGPMCVGVLALTVFQNRRATVLLVAAGAAAALVVSAAGLRGLSARFAELIAQHGDPSRLATWRDTLRIAPEFMWAGSGLGTFAFVFRRSEPYLSLKSIDHAHSDYLELLVELGAPGAILFFGVIGYVFVDTLRQLPATRDPRTRWMALGCLLGAGGIFLHAAADFPLQIPAVAAMAAVLLGLARGLVVPARHVAPLHCAASAIVCGVLCLVSVGFLQGHWAGLDAEALGREARSAAMRGEAEAAEAGYAAALNANPFASAVWLARGELAETNGDSERALDMVELAQRIEPFTLRTEWALANAYLRREQRDQAAPHFGILSRSIPEMRVGIVEAAWAGGIPVVDVASAVVPADGEAAGEFLNFLVRKKAWDGLAPAHAAFDETVRRSIPVDLMRYAFDQAFAAGETEAYLGLWEETSKDGEDNGGAFSIAHHGPPETFGQDGYGLRWAVRPHRRVTTRVVADAGTPLSIEIAFTAPQDLHYSNVSHDFVVRPSRRYELRAEVQAEEITSSQGVRLLVAGPGGTLVQSQPIRGTKDWRDVRLAFRTGAKDRVLRLYIVRYPSKTFDRDVTGRFWIRDVGVVQR